MCEYLEFIRHIIILIAKDMNFIDVISNLVSIFVGVVTGVSLIIGLRYVKSFKDKTTTATFTFWSQISIRLHEISLLLNSNNTLIDNLYSTISRTDWEELGRSEDIKLFKEKIEAVIEYIEKTPDQMPAYIGWTDDYVKLTDFLYDMIIYDICDPDKSFKFEELKTKEDRSNYCNEMCQLMNRICDKIHTRQKDIEKKICKQ